MLTGLRALAAASCRDTGGFSRILLLPGITITVVILPETPEAVDEEQMQFPVEELIVQELHRVRLVQALLKAPLSHAPGWAVEGRGTHTQNRAGGTGGTDRKESRGSLKAGGLLEAFKPPGRLCIL